MDNKPEKQIVLVRETTAQSIVQDIFTYGVTLFAFWFNYNFIGGNDALDVLLFISFFTISLSHLKNYKLLNEKVNGKEQ